MKKAQCVIVAILLSLTLCSCAVEDSMMLLGDRDSKLAHARMEQLFHAIQQQDESGIKDLFSAKAVAEAADIDAEIDHLLSFIQGEVVAWKSDGLPPVVVDDVDYGNKSKQLLMWFVLRTDEQNYMIFLADYPIDTINPENQGLYSIRILKSEDEYKLVGGMEDWVIPGIYVLE